MSAPEITPTEKEACAQAIVRECFDQNPEMVQRYGAKGREKCLQDTRFHLQYLFEAVVHESASLFIDYVAWAKVMLEGVKVPAKDLEANLVAMRKALQEAQRPTAWKTACNYLDESIAALPNMAVELPSFIEPRNPHYRLAAKYLELLLKAERRAASQLILGAVDGGMSVREVYLHVFQPVQHEIGRLWQSNQLSVAQEHFCTAATQLIMSQLYPRIFNTEKNGLKMLATCVGSELHEIGVRMVTDFFEMDGWDTFYVGANSPVNTIVRMLISQKIELLAISATMTFHVEGVVHLIAAVRAEPQLRGTRILVGGYPFNVDPDLWRKVGADGYGASAENSERVARRLFFDESRA